MNLVLLQWLSEQSPWLKPFGNQRMFLYKRTQVILNVLLEESCASIHVLIYTHKSKELRGLQLPFNSETSQQVSSRRGKAALHVASDLLADISNRSHVYRRKWTHHKKKGQQLSFHIRWCYSFTTVTQHMLCFVEPCVWRNMWQEKFSYLYSLTLQRAYHGANAHGVQATSCH